MNTVEKNKNRLLAAADIVDHGDLAVVKKIYDFMEFLDNWEEKIEALKAEIEASNVTELKSSFDDLSMSLETTNGQIDIILQEIGEMASMGQKMDEKHSKEMEKMMKEMHSTLEKSIESVKKLIPEMPDAFDPTDILNRVTEIESRIPTIPDEITPYQVRDKLELIDNESEKLSIDAIKDLRKELDELKKRTASKMPVGGFNYNSMSFHIIDDETPVGTINSSNTVFNIANVPNPASSLKVYLNGARQRITEDYTLSGTTITFTIAPQTNSILLVDYRI